MNNIKVEVKINTYEMKKKVFEELKKEQEERLQAEDMEFMRDLIKSHIKVYEAKIELVAEFLEELRSL